MSDSAIHRSKRQSIDSSAEKNICIFFEKKTGKLHEYSTFSSGNTLKNIALEMQDTTLMAKSSASQRTETNVHRFSGNIKGNQIYLRKVAKLERLQN